MKPDGLRGWILILASLILISSCSANSLSSTEIPTIGKIVKCDSISYGDLSVGPELPCLDDQSKIDISTLKGPLILNVWGSWCGPCKEEIPIFRTFYAKAKSQISLLGVDVEEARTSEGINFVIANGMTWPNVYDPDGRTRGYFGPGVPVTWFIAVDGTVMYKKIGVIDNEQELRDLTAKYLQITVS